MYTYAFILLLLKAQSKLVRGRALRSCDLSTSPSLPLARVAESGHVGGFLLTCQLAMSALTLTPETCLGPASSPPHFTDTETTVRVAGQRLVFAPCSCLHAKQGSHFQTGGTPYGIALVAVCPKAKLVAFAEREVDATVHVWGIGSMSRLASLTAAGKHLEVLALAFCRDGSRVAAVGGAPGLELSVWQWSTRKLLVTLPLAVPCADLSFDPRSASSLCALAGAKLQVCAVKQTYEHFTASATELSPADEVGTGGVWACHAWGAASELYAGTDTGAVTCSSTDAGGMSQRLVLASGSAVAGLVADARLLLVASRDGVLTWYSVATAEALYEVRVEGAIASVAVSPDYLKILATTASGDAHLVTMLTAELPETALEPEEVGAFLAVEKVPADPLPLPSPSTVASHPSIGPNPRPHCSTPVPVPRLPRPKSFPTLPLHAPPLHPVRRTRTPHPVRTPNRPSCRRHRSTRVPLRPPPSFRPSRNAASCPRKPSLSPWETMESSDARAADL